MNLYLALVLAGYGVRRKILADGSIELTVWSTARTARVLDHDEVLAIAQRYVPGVVAE